MRRLIMLGVLLSAAQAGAVTIDFEDITVRTQAPLTVAGFTFTSDSPNPAFVATSPGTDGQALGCGDGCTFTMQAESGDLFSLDAIDAYGGSFESFSTGVILYGFFDDGSSLRLDANLLFNPGGDVYTFAPGWTNLSRIEISSGFFSSRVNAGFAIDNIQASVVPVPAAAWLFGSALAGLGWMRRQSAV